MANELTTVFIPIIAEERMGVYESADFQINPRQNDRGIDIQFASQDAGDKAIWMIAPGEAFFVSAGTAVSFANGPEITAPADKNVAVVHVFSTNKWAPILSASGQPVAEWWALEGIGQTSFELMFVLYDLEIEASNHGYGSGDEFRDAVLSGEASLNVLMADGLPVSLGSLETAGDSTVTLGLRAWATYDSGPSELDAANALATIKQLAPTALAAHPLLNGILIDVSSRDVNIHVRFVYWETKRDAAGTELNATSETDKGQFVPVPDGSTISLQKRSAGIYTPIAEETVQDNGQVELTVPRADLTAIDVADGESLEFRLDVPPGTYFIPQYQHAHHERNRNPFDADPELPRAGKQELTWGVFTNAWITEGRSTTDEAIDSLDFLVSYENSIVGTADQPIEYFAGIPLFLQIQYPVVSLSGTGVSAKFRHETRKAPKGIRVELYDAGPSFLATYRTDEHGQIWGSLLLGYESLNLPLEVKVIYDMVDRGIGLLTVEGEVVEGSNLPVTEYSSNTDGSNSAPFSGPILSSIGKSSGTAVASNLATVQVGFVTISASPAEFSSKNGRHAGIMHSLQQVRYVHQWFHYLTKDLKDGAGNDISWKNVLTAYSSEESSVQCEKGGVIRTIKSKVKLPRVRVTEGKALLSPSGDIVVRAGEVTSYGEKSEHCEGNIEPVNPGWLLTIYGHDAYSMTDKETVWDPIAAQLKDYHPKLEERIWFWRTDTVWHEYTHIIANIAQGRLADFNAQVVMISSKDPDTSSNIYRVIGDGYSVLDEAIPAIPEVALHGKVSLTSPAFDPSSTASPRYMEVSDGVANILLKDGITTNNVLDWRLGLRIPVAFTWGIWTALRDTGGFNDTLYGIFGGSPQGNDLADNVAYLKSADSQRIFGALVWGPLVSLREPQNPGMFPPEWDDINGGLAGSVGPDKGAAGPPHGAAGSIRTRVNGPSTHRYLELIEQKYWGKLKANEKTAIKELFGDVDDKVVPADVSFYLWFDF